MADAPTLTSPSRVAFMLRLLPWAVGLAAVTYAVLTLAAYKPYLTSPYVFDDDHRQHLLPVYAALHPDQFREGFLLDYARHYVPVAYQGLTRVLGWFGDPLFGCKMLGMGLLVWTYLAGLALGWRLAGPVAGSLTLMLVVHAGIIETSTFSGLFRSFAFPVVLTFLLGVVRRNHGLALTALGLAALFYPPVFLVCWLAFAFWLAPQARSLLRERRAVLVAFAAVSLACAALMVVFEHKPPSFGRPFTKKEAQNMPEWNRKDGRLAAFPLDTRTELIRRTVRAGLKANPWERAIAPSWVEWADQQPDAMTIGWFVLFGAALFLKPRPWWWLATVGSSLVMLQVARHIAFRLGPPDRYVVYTLPVATILLLPLAWGAARRLSACWGGMWRAAGTVACAALFVLTPYGLGGGFEDLTDASDLRPEWEAIRALPPGVLFGGWPGDMDSIPLMTQRETFVDEENAAPLYKTHYARVSERLMDSMRFVLATNLTVIREVTLKYGLTHALISRQMLTHEGRPPWMFEPFGDQAYVMWSKPAPDQFAFNHVPPEAVVYRGRDYFIVDLRRWLAPAPAR